MQNNKFLNSCGLFVNKRKESASHPDYTGTMVLGDEVLDALIAAKMAGKDTKIDFSVWAGNKDKNGSPYLSLKAKKAWEPTGAPRQQQATAQSFRQEPNDEIPF